MSGPEHHLLLTLRACLERPRPRMASELHAAHGEGVAALAAATGLSFQALLAGDVTANEQGSPGWIKALRMHIRHTTVIPESRGS